MTHPLHISSSPHAFGGDSTARIMWGVVLALLPATLWGVYAFGPRAAWVVGLSVAGCAAAEAGVQALRGRAVTVADGSAATLLETHAVYERGPFNLRALYASWDLDGAAPKALGRDEQTGWYVEPSWRFSEQFGVFARYAEWDNEAGNSADTEKEQWNLGANYWPHEDVVIKVDLQQQDGAADDDGFNLGIGYQF